MDAATKTLLVGGVSVLALGFLLGLPLAAIRMRAPQAPRYLVLAHLGSIIQGAVLLALTLVVGFSDLSAGTEAIAAWLLVGGAAAIALGDTVNWLQGVDDPFRAKNAGYLLQSVGAPPATAGLLILLIGAVRAL